MVDLRSTGAVLLGEPATWVRVNRNGSSLGGCVVSSTIASQGAIPTKYDVGRGG